ncbi:g8748 [Coccomyxa viridis]|uniref:G8748 protein n=1 Tax=Coccomyxa viridis TaxID=1274662 RepID=A0ABP1G140_9CHLO
MACLWRCAEPRTHQDFVKRESRINCLMFAHAHRVELARCFMEVDKREIMADFVSKCQNASTCELWDRMGKGASTRSSGTASSTGLLQKPTGKRRHWAYDTSTIAAELTRLSLTRAMDDLVLMAEDLL